MKQSISAVFHRIVKLTFYGGWHLPEEERRVGSAHPLGCG